MQIVGVPSGTTYPGGACPAHAEVIAEAGRDSLSCSHAHSFGDVPTTTGLYAANVDGFLASVTCAEQVALAVLIQLV